MLSELKNDILCVRGNCDTEVDQMVLPFPLLADYAVILDGRHPIYATHGHVYGEDNPPPLGDGDILLCGHTHDGQFFPLNIAIRSVWENPSGLLKKDDMYSIVTSGVGIYGPDMRVGTDADITVVEIELTGVKAEP